MTRKWCKTDGSDHTLNLTRELIRNRLRIQSFEVRVSIPSRAESSQLDPYVRGRSVYHRHGNIVGNGLVSFEYPSNSEGPEYEGAQP